MLILFVSYAFLCGSELYDDTHKSAVTLWYKCRVRIGAEAGRAPCQNRISAMEKSIRGFAEHPGDNVIVPKLGTSFHTLGEAYDFYNL